MRNLIKSKLAAVTAFMFALLFMASSAYAQTDPPEFAGGLSLDDFGLSSAAVIAVLTAVALISGAIIGFRLLRKQARSL